VRLSEFDPARFQREARGVLAELDITILCEIVQQAATSAASWHPFIRALFEARLGYTPPRGSPISAAALQLGLTQGRVRHRSFKARAALEAAPDLAGHHAFFTELLTRQFYYLPPPT
jgi:hypothetical protein